MTTPVVVELKQDGEWVSTAALVVATCALLFTVGSYWWLNARQGRLKAYEPHSFAAMVSGAFVLFLRFPLVLYNTGPKPIVVQDLQLRFPDEPKAVFPLPWRTSRSELQPGPNDGHAMPAVFSVPGRGVARHFIEFGGPFPGFELTASDYRVQIRARLGHRNGWTNMLDFTLRAAHITEPNQYIAYSNSPHDLTPEDIAKANEGLKDLMQRLEEYRSRATAGVADSAADESPPE